MDMIVPGDSFGEIFAASPGSILNVSVIADSDCQILMMNLKRILSVCPSSCSHHRKLIQNLVSSLAKKALRFNHKITHMSKRSTREKLLSFLSAESIQHGSLCFPISYNRQQLADYLCVDRQLCALPCQRYKKKDSSLTRKTALPFTSMPRKANRKPLGSLLTRKGLAKSTNPNSY